MNKIVCAATEYEINGEIIVIADSRHMFKNQAAILELLIKDGYDPIEIEQGFIDKFGVFHNREKAYEIAKNADQIIGHVFDGTLYSENLY